MIGSDETDGLDPKDVDAPFLVRPYQIGNVIEGTPEKDGETGKTNYTGIGPFNPIGGDASNVGLTTPLHRNGGSPNLFAWGLSASSMSTDSSYDFLQKWKRTDTYTFGCYVYKIIQNGAHAGKYNAPAGLQVPSNNPNRAALTETDTTRWTDSTYSRASSGGGPVPSSTQVPAEMVVCISPNSTTKGKPGTWRVQNSANISADRCNSESNRLVDAGYNVPSSNAPTTNP
jgi:hypothetical protein